MPFPAPSPETVTELRRVITAAVAAGCPAALRGQEDDIAQVAVCKVVALIEARGGTYNHAYLRRVAFTAMIDALRRRRPEAPTAVDPAELARSEGPDPEALARDRRLGLAIQACLEALSPDRRRAVTLHLLGHELREIGPLLGVEGRQAENLTYRGLGSLRVCLRNKGMEP